MMMMTMTISCKFIYLEFEYDYYDDDGDKSMALECPYCDHIWQPKVLSPMACPKCKRYFADDNLPGEIDNYVPQGRIKRPVVASIPKTNHPSPSAYVQCYRGARFGTCGERAVIKLGKHSYCLEHGIEKLKELQGEMEDKELS